MEKTDWTLTVSGGRTKEGSLELYHVTTSTGEIESYSSIHAAKLAVYRYLDHQKRKGGWIER